MNTHDSKSDLPLSSEWTWLKISKDLATALKYTKNQGKIQVELQLYNQWLFMKGLLSMFVLFWRVFSHVSAYYMYVYP